MDINNREYAAIIWFLIVFSLLMIKKDIRKAVSELLRVLMHKQIIMVFSGALAWIVICISILNKIEVWSINNLKTTVVWIITFAFAALFKTKEIEKDVNYFKNQVKNIFKITVILTFIMELHSFSLPFEFVLWAIIIMLSLMIAVGEMKEHTKKLSQFMTYILAVVVIFYFIHSLYLSSISLSETFSKNNITEFLIPIILSLVFLPFVYLFYLYQSYELAFVGLKFKLNDSISLKKTMLMAVFNFRSNIDGLRRWVREIGNEDDTFQLKKKIKEIKERMYNECYPPSVLPSNGWSPYMAVNFLLDINLVTNDYHPQDNEWWASSKMLEIGDEEIIRDNISYYIYGGKDFVKCLKLRAHINNVPIANSSTEFITLACSILLKKSAPNIDLDIENTLHTLNDFSVEYEGYNISLDREDFVGSIKGYTLNLVISMK
ncbi:hypothetical protein WFP14_14910 [Yersinia proxima]|uniref:Inner membrane protein n=1 Tax=Yersinia proxima TaxID=2890316 RepID=A0ABW9F0I2_9GAMM